MYLKEMRDAARAANKAGVDGRLEPKEAKKNVKKAAEGKLDQIENEVDSIPKPNAVIEISTKAKPPATETPAPAKAKEKRKKTRRRSGKKKHPGATNDATPTNTAQSPEIPLTVVPTMAAVNVATEVTVPTS